MSSGLASLPKEVVWYIAVNYLDFNSLQSLLLTNKHFYQSFNDDFFWFKKCQIVLNTVSPGKDDLVFEDFSKWHKLLYLIERCHKLLGYWQRCIDIYTGEVLRFTFCAQRYAFIGECCCCDVDGVSFGPVVEINIDGMKLIENGTKDFKFIYDEVDSVISSCSTKLPPDEHSQYCAKILYSNESLEFKYTSKTKVTYLDDFLYSQWIKLKSPLSSFCAADPFHPGVFTALYGGHGYELIHVTIYDNKIIGSKLTGDRNVPFGKHSFVAQLNKKVMLTYDQQKSIRSCVDSGEELEENAHLQPFRIPDDCIEEPTEDISSYKWCLARYVGKGTVAYDLYHEPKWSPLHFIVLDEDHFSILWKELKCMSVFTRKKDVMF